MIFRIALLTILLLAILSGSAFAQERGQYVPGFSGLNSGLQAPPGITYANVFFWYPTHKLKDANGNDRPVDVDINLLADVNLLAYTTKHKFLGATYGMAIAVPLLNTPISLSNLGTGVSPKGLGDIYFEPVNLGWKLKKADVKLAYGVTAPTGKFGPPSEMTSSGYWGHSLTFANTIYLDPNKLTQFSFSTTWEFHHKKRHEAVKVGNNMTFEAGAGKIFVKNQGKQLIQFGVVGYAEFQLTRDSGAAVPVLTAGNKDRVFALGPELGVILPGKKFNFFIRVLPEFGARSRTQGVTLMTGIGKSF
jgi:hypothetical protein